jgi:hypothetical protein
MPTKNTELDVVIVRVGDRRGVWLNPEVKLTPEVHEAIRENVGRCVVLPYTPHDMILGMHGVIYQSTKEQWEHVIGLAVCEMATRMQFS